MPTHCDCECEIVIDKLRDYVYKKLSKKRKNKPLSLRQQSVKNYLKNFQCRKCIYSNRSNKILL